MVTEWGRPDLTLFATTIFEPSLSPQHQQFARNSARALRPLFPVSLSYTYDAIGWLPLLTENGANSIISLTTYRPAGELAMSGSWGSESRSYNAMKQMTGLTRYGTQVLPTPIELVKLQLHQTG